MKRKLLLIAFFCMGLMFAENLEEKSKIELTSLVEQKVNPDQIFLQIELDSKQNNDKTALQKIKNIVEKAGIDTKKNFKTIDMENSLQEVWFGSDIVNTLQKFQITASNTKQVYQIFEKMKKIKASKVKISAFDYSKKEELKLELLAKAVKLAKEKAEIMASALGQKVGKAILIREEKVWQSSNSKILANRYLSDESSKFKKVEVPEFEKLKYKAEVFVIFELN